MTNYAGVSSKSTYVYLSTVVVKKEILLSVLLFLVGYLFPKVKEKEGSLLTCLPMAAGMITAISQPHVWASIPYADMCNLLSAHH